MPLEFDHSRQNEPFLRLAPPFQTIIVTPPRRTDAYLVLEYLNDPRVYNSLIGPPFPYRMEDYELWAPTIEDECSKGLLQYLEVEGTMIECGTQDKRKWTDAVPVRSIREVDPKTGEQRYIGDIGFAREGYVFDFKKDEEERKTAQKRNASYEAGNPRIEWTIGDYLAPSHHGRGIMTAVIRTVINEYAIPYMNVDRIVASYFEHNIGSRRVFEKNGFTFQGMDPHPLRIPESKGGGAVFQGNMLWQRNGRHDE